VRRGVTHRQPGRNPLVFERVVHPGHFPLASWCRSRSHSRLKLRCPFLAGFLARCEMLRQSGRENSSAKQHRPRARVT
jgi:hypothetical protein